MISTCGHKAKKGIKLAFKINPIIGKPFIGHGVYCEKCAKQYKALAGAWKDNGIS